jgi:hypothetical protein
MWHNYFYEYLIVSLHFTLCEIEMLISVISLYKHTKLHTAGSVARKQSGRGETRNVLKWESNIKCLQTYRKVGGEFKKTFHSENKTGATCRQA